MCWISVAMQAFSQFVASRGLLSCGAWALGHVGFRSCACWALEGGLSSCGAQAQFPHGMWSLPRSGIKPVSPALAGGFFTTEPPWKTPPPRLQLLDHPTLHWPSSQSPGLVPVVVGWAPCLDVYLGMHWVSVSEKGNERVRSWMRRG